MLRLPRVRHEPTKKCRRFRGSATAFVHDVSPRSAWRPQYLEDGGPQSKVKQQRGSLPEFLKSGARGLSYISEGKGNRRAGTPYVEGIVCGVSHSK